MALEAVVFQQDPFVSCLREMGDGGVGPWSDVYCHVPKIGMPTNLEKKCIDENPYLEIPNTWNYRSHGSGFSSNTSLEYSSPSSLEEPFAIGNSELWDTTCSMTRENSAGYSPVVARRKRRRIRCVKNQKEVEHQRMTHINVERNRRKQMNEYLKVLRSMLPPSYSQRGDQASIVGGAINFMKQLEQLLQSLESNKATKNTTFDSTSPISPFSNFLTFPQYSTYSKTHQNTKNTLINSHNNQDQAKIIDDPQNKLPIADVAVRLAESHADLKILTRKQPEQLIKMVTGLYSIGLGILHLNVTTLNHSVLYSISVKVEQECQLASVDEIATAVYEMVGRIQEEATHYVLLRST